MSTAIAQLSQGVIILARNRSKDAVEMAKKNQRILESAFRLFSANTIEKIKLTEVAADAGIGIASLYRYYPSKPELVLAVSTWAWTEYLSSNPVHFTEQMTAAERLSLHLDAFLELYKNHRDLLRFNQFFNVYIQSEYINIEQLQEYRDVAHTLEGPFADTYHKGEKDGTIHTDISEKQMFSSILHLMLAAVTRYAVGLAYTEETNPEEELKMLRDMLFARFTE